MKVRRHRKWACGGTLTILKQVMFNAIKSLSLETNYDNTLFPPILEVMLVVPHFLKWGVQRTSYLFFIGSNFETISRHYKARFTRKFTCWSSTLRQFSARKRRHPGVMSRPSPELSNDGDAIATVSGNAQCQAIYVTTAKLAPFSHELSLVLISFGTTYALKLSSRIQSLRCLPPFRCHTHRRIPEPLTL